MRQRWELFWLVSLFLFISSLLCAAPDPKDLEKAKAVAKTAKQGTPIGTRSFFKNGSFQIELAARLQHYEANPEHPQDFYDEDIQSPKSAKFLPDGSKAYVNSLEGFATPLYSPLDWKKLGVIRHRFNEENASLLSNQKPFDYQFFIPQKDADRFSGKPVEMEFSHQGRYLWISYYRRDWDENSMNPSAVAVVDTREDKIVTVLPSGPIPKYLAASPDGKWMAFVHWGDNTVGFVDIRSENPSEFKLSHLITVQNRLPLAAPKEGEPSVDRDKECGWCLRGSVFTPDSKFLLVGRLSEGGIAVIDVEKKKYLGTAWGMKPTPRHLVIGNDGRWVYVSSNVGGFVSKFEIDKLIKAAQAKENKLKPASETYVGYGVRTIDISPDGRWIYAAVNGESKLVVLSSEKLKKEAEITVDSFPVGLAVSPDGSQIWVTSQGRSLRGGNSVSIYRLSEKN